MLIDLNHLVHMHRLTRRRIVHVGGNVGEEGGLYTAWKSQVVWFEPRTDAAATIRRKYPSHLVVEAAAGSDFGRADLRIASNGQSSSLLEPKLHLELHPEVAFGNSLSVPVVPVDLVVQECDGLVVDAQGYEAMVLRGASRCLRICSWVYLEVNSAELFEGCPLIGDLDRILHNFTRIETEWTPGKYWGDALWVRR